MNVPAPSLDMRDGPTLLLPEISALIRNLIVWLPFHASAMLADRRWLGSQGRAICGDWSDGDYTHLLAGQPIEAVYFGVPTIVGDTALFGEPNWTTHRARAAARHISKRAEVLGARIIVSGLGSGDISVEDRITDMGGGNVVAFKHFGLFQDWVIARWL